MRKFTIIFTVFFVIAVSVNAQITNNGFENWTTTGNYENPDGWATMNSLSTGPFYSCQKSSDPYPPNVGNYSIKINNDVSLTQLTGGWGIAVTNAMDYPFKPAFHITGHPTSLTGYFRYISQNADSMFVKIILFNNGVIVANNEFSTGVTTISWTSFTIPIPTYTTADSATILLSAFYPTGPTDGPNGNSSLKIDNLNFDVLISSVADQNPGTVLFSLYPNPASDIVTINIENNNNENVSLNIFNVVGSLVKSAILNQNQNEINVSDLSNGVYVVEFQSQGKSERQKLIIQK